jgi:hypothetical protein
MPGITAPRARRQRNKNSGLEDIIAAERLDEWGKLDKKHRLPGQPKRRPTRNTKRVKVMDNLSDVNPDDDGEYQTEVVDSTSEATQASNTEDDISNKEVSPISPVLLYVQYLLKLVSVSRCSSLEDSASSNETNPCCEAKAF